jgi:prefoldin subunit 5
MPAYGPYPYEPTEEDLKAEIDALEEEKKDIDAEIAEIEKMIKEKAPRPLDNTRGKQARGEGGK